MKRRHSLPPEVYALVEQTPETVLLEGRSAPCYGNPQQASNDNPHPQPWTRLFTAPYRVCTAHEPAEIPPLFAAIEVAVAAGHTAAGFFSYECGVCFEPTATVRPTMLRSPEVPLAQAPLAQVPLAWIGFYERSYPFDHATGEFVNGAPPELERLLNAGQSSAESSQVAGAEVEADFALTQAEYAERIAAIHEWIRSGDVYQLNFTAPWRIESAKSPAQLYASLRARQPVDYGAFLHWLPGRRILSFSPELFFRVDDEGKADERGARRITTRPMKGTAPRGRTTAEDRAHAEWLANDPKNRSENVMIVDLLRNDLGRLSRYGSVDAMNLFATEKFSTLWQMTSTVAGELRPEVGFADIFRALFPSGSITGAPKVRAMQLIAGIESQPRGVYTGAIGFFARQESVFNVAIRTLDLAPDAGGCRGTMGTGSGIVIDSDAATEYREVLLKAKFLTGRANRGSGRSLSRCEFSGFSLIESLLWDRGFPLIELHLDRLMDSAGYFDFPCSREEVKTALERHALKFTDGAQRKVRLLVDNEDSLQITDETLPASCGQARIGRVRIAREHTDPADAMLFHKTTERRLFAQALKQATEAGFDDALFFNLHGELTEGAISNVFVEKDGRWLTPPIHCGLLAGVYRRHLLETRPEIEKRVLLIDDLRTADAIYLANAVRGLRRVTIDWEN